MTGILPLLLVAALAPTQAHGEDCTFDQQGVAAELQRVASANPGFTPVPGMSAVEWREPSGATVRLAYGGCVDLGVQIRLDAAPGAPHPLSTRELLGAVARYWSGSTARAVEAELRAGRFTRTSEGGATVIELGVGDAFPFGATLRIDARQASLAWTAG